MENKLVQMDRNYSPVIRHVGEPISFFLSKKKIEASTSEMQYLYSILVFIVVSRRKKTIINNL